MKRILLIIFLLVTVVMPVYCESVIRGGVSMSDRVPGGFFGTWKVTSVQTYTNNPMLFTERSTDYWNLSKEGDVITLSNPVSGAVASVTVNEVRGDSITFTRKKKDRNENVTETPTLTLKGEKFFGTDRIVIDKYRYGELVSTDIVEYRIDAVRVSGDGAEKILGVR